MTNKFKPILSGTLKDLDDLIFPVIASPKIDGIRSVINEEGQFITRTLKPIRNKYIQSELKWLHNHLANSVVNLDGELTAGEPYNVIDANIFNVTQSAFMSYDGKPECTYWVFDCLEDLDAPYSIRSASYSKRVEEIQSEVDHMYLGSSIIFRRLETRVCNNVEEVIAYEKSCLEIGFEGIMTRKPDMPYKCGRSSPSKTQQHLLKLKRFEDAEAEIIGFEEECENIYRKADGDIISQMDYDNHPKMSMGEVRDYYCCVKHGADVIPKDRLGALKVRALNGEFKGVEFNIGTGFTDKMRVDIWEGPAKLGKVVNFTYQACGSKDAPRFPSFKGFRDKEDF